MKALTYAFDAMSLPSLIQLKIETFDYIDGSRLLEGFLFWNGCA